ncbi:hypothetical protein ACFQLX_19700 [Streptomyces polyrhachis]|uniref:Uncharacterized protein n=1 Tax=Streptomyces polyrhachis TaxID=1282885 RepID=A0ABW2GIB7_9ACTN
MEERRFRGPRHGVLGVGAVEPGLLAGDDEVVGERVEPVGDGGPQAGRVRPPAPEREAVAVQAVGGLEQVGVLPRLLVVAPVVRGEGVVRDVVQGDGDRGLLNGPRRQGGGYLPGVAA